MGKTSKWIRNFFIGKKEEGEKKKYGSSTTCYAESLGTPIAVTQATPKERRRWSFGRSTTSTDTPAPAFDYSSARSFDSIVSTQLVARALLDYEIEQSYRTSPIALTATISAAKRALAAAGNHRHVEDAAAIKIQSVFRGYLAKKALCALRGLVKLQALARGHLVRKQTTAMVRCMHALMAIQVRARVQRLQMAEEAHSATKRRPANGDLAHDNKLTRIYDKAMDVNGNDKWGSLKSRSASINKSKIERIGEGLSTPKSNRDQHHHHHRPCISPRSCNNKKPSQPMMPDSVDSILHDYLLPPNYMANTESSSARVRSQSEPKQRPRWNTKQSKRRTESMGGMGVTQDMQKQPSSMAQVRLYAPKKKYPAWLMKLYRPTEYVECDSTSTMTYDSSHCSTSTAFEPPVNLY